MVTSKVSKQSAEQRRVLAKLRMWNKRASFSEQEKVAAKLAASLAQARRREKRSPDVAAFENAVDIVHYTTPFTNNRPIWVEFHRAINI